MGLLKALDPPALLGDFNAAQKKKWSKYISDQLDAELTAAAVTISTIRWSPTRPRRQDRGNLLDGVSPPGADLHRDG